MNNRIWPILLIALITISCDKYNLEIDSKFRTAINSYQINDTIYFQSEQNTMEFDTIRISGIDSIRQYPVISDVHPMKEIRLRVEHLPIDNWKEPKITGRKIRNQPIITAENSFENCCNLRISYREFNASILKTEFNKSNEIDTLKRDSPIKIKDDYITELYWSNQKGIVGYKKHNGQTYRKKT